ncbi:MAG: T9SS type A sorting domain-containing protein, partial [Bacteroidetes bacterium]|nr:T9SS type A sorting domain-containing protein [Bacteroidota bacterium]
RLFDLSGKLIRSVQLPFTTPLTILNSELPDGIYLVSISEDNQVPRQLKLIK